jgi:hypothetical protein
MASPSKASSCCALEKKRLMAELKQCDFCTSDYEAFHRCYRKAARESGERAKACMLG